MEAADRELRANGIAGPRRKTALDLLTVLLEAAPSHSFTIEDLGRTSSHAPVGRCVSFCAILMRSGSWRATPISSIHIAHGVPKPVADRLAEIARFERTLIDALEPDLLAAPAHGCHRQPAATRAGPPRPGGQSGHRPDQVVRLLRALAMDGRRDLDEMPPLELRQVDRERIHLTLHGDMDALREASSRRQAVASLLVKGADPSPREGRAGRGLFRFPSR